MGKETLWDIKKKENIKNVVRQSKHLFEKKGYHNTSIKELCGYALISKTTFFNYFESKDTILRIIYEEALEELSEFIENDLAEESDAFEKLKKIFSKMLNDSLVYHNVSAVFYEFMLENKEIRQLAEKYEEVISPFIQQAIIQKSINPDYSVKDIYRLFHGCYLSAIFSITSESKVEIFNKAYSTLINLLQY